MEQVSRKRKEEIVEEEISKVKEEIDRTEAFIKLRRQHLEYLEHTKEGIKKGLFDLIQSLNQ